MDHQEGILRFADLALRPNHVQLPLLGFKLHLVPADADDFYQIPEVHQRNPPAQSRQNPVLDPQLNRGEVDPDHAIPEDHGQQEHRQQQAHRAPKDRPAIQETIFRNIGTQYVQPEKLEQDGGRGGHAEQPQQLTALRQPLDALGGAGLWNGPEIHPEERRRQRQKQPPGTGN